jgi:polysaccharide biosynthesis transport protein
LEPIIGANNKTRLGPNWGMRCFFIMLEINRALPRSNVEPVRQIPSGLAEGIKSLAIVRRQLPIFLTLILCAMVLGLSYLLTTPSSYTAVAEIVVDMRKAQAFQQQVMGDVTRMDAAAVQTQVEVLMSHNVSLAVIKALKLTEDPEFIQPSAVGAIFNAIFKLISGPSKEPLEFQLQRRALATFEARRKITRIPQTYGMEISFRSLDPGKAARIANAIGDAYIVDQLEAKYEASRRASAWLLDRIKSLREDALAAEQAIVVFKQNNNIVESGGKLMNEQQMSEVNSQLILAHAATAEAKARLDRIQQVMSQDIPDSSLIDALKSQVIIKLREQYLELAGKEAIWSKSYGRDHVATTLLRNQMMELRRNIADEMGKFAESYKNDYEIARARENSIQKSLDSAVAYSQIANQAQVHLRELESNAHTARTIYESILQRHMEAVGQQSFPISEARVITPADPPSTRSHPNTLLVLVVSAAGGMVVAFGAAALREACDRTFRTEAQVDHVLHVNRVLMLPLLKPVAPNVSDKQDDAAAFAKRRHIRRCDNLLRYVVDEPFSQFTELLRSLKVTADLNRGVEANRVIAITSSLSNEGKSTIAANFASMIAHSGSRVILVDADLRVRSLSQDLAPGAAAGLVEVAAGQTALDDAIWTDCTTGLAFLPSGPGSASLLHPNETLALVAIKSLFDKLRGAFDYVIVDLPPLAPVADARTTTNFIDSYVYVVEWGRTKIDVVAHSLSQAREVYDRLLAVVLNKADMSVLQRYEQYRKSFQYGR